MRQMMATFYPSSSSQSDDLQSSHPGNQKLASDYSELPSHLSNIKIYMNQAPGSGSYLDILSGGCMPSQNCVEFPSVGTRNEMMFIPPTSDTVNLQSTGGQLNSAAGNLVGNSVSQDSQAVPARMQLGIPDSERNFQSQGLSLSLGSQVQSAASVPSFQYQYPDQNFSSFLSTHLPVPGRWTVPCENDDSNNSNELRNSVGLPGFAGSNHNPIKTESSHNPQFILGYKGMHESSGYGYANFTLNSRYLKAARDLLDEVVNLRKALKQQSEPIKCVDDSMETDRKASSKSMHPTSKKMSSNPAESTADSTPEVSPAERQDLQYKKTKLLSMLDEVDRKYKQYKHQMQNVVSSFDMVAGHAAAKSYTALAFQTISCHFRCLCDAISGQIEVIRNRLGDVDTSQNGQGGIPRLRYVDHQVRQQRALQQLGVMRHAWRPQRGLPETAVSVLRAWLFEHFLHPYPSDSEKISLARQAGLTRNQVANWFINARVRLWKPMVEDMYKEEFGDLEENSKSSLDDGTNAHGDAHMTSEKRPDEFHESEISTAADSATAIPGQVHDLKPSHILELEMKRPRAITVLGNDSDGHNVAESVLVKFQREQESNIDVDILGRHRSIPCDQNGDGNLMSAAVTYDASGLNGFGIGSQMSLALGLQSHESNAFPMFGAAHMRGNNTEVSSMEPDEVDYHCVDTGKQPHRFANSHLLHDFVV